MWRGYFLGYMFYQVGIRNKPHIEFDFKIDGTYFKSIVANPKLV